jgi:hypothetical protein
VFAFVFIYKAITGDNNRPDNGMGNETGNGNIGKVSNSEPNYDDLYSVVSEEFSKLLETTEPPYTGKVLYQTRTEKEATDFDYAGGTYQNVQNTDVIYDGNYYSTAPPPPVIDNVKGNLIDNKKYPTFGNFYTRNMYGYYIYEIGCIEQISESGGEKSFYEGMLDYPSRPSFTRDVMGMIWELYAAGNGESVYGEKAYSGAGKADGLYEIAEPVTVLRISTRAADYKETVDIVIKISAPKNGVTLTTMSMLKSGYGVGEIYYGYLSASSVNSAIKYIKTQVGVTPKPDTNWQSRGNSADGYQYITPPKPTDVFKYKTFGEVQKVYGDYIIGYEAPEEGVTKKWANEETSFAALNAFTKKYYTAKLEKDWSWYKDEGWAETKLISINMENYWVEIYYGSTSEVCIAKVIFTRNTAADILDYTTVAFKVSEEDVVELLDTMKIVFAVGIPYSP